jgi:hypothetical protein
VGVTSHLDGAAESTTIENAKVYAETPRNFKPMAHVATKSNQHHPEASTPKKAKKMRKNGTTTPTDTPAVTIMIK